MNEVKTNADRMIKAYGKAFREIMDTDEIGKIIKYAHGFEKLWLKRFKAAYDKLDKENYMPIWTWMLLIKSTHLLADIMIYAPKYMDEEEQ